MNQRVRKLFEKLEKNPVLLDRLSKAKSVEDLYKKAVKIVDGYTINDLRFALEELEIIPHRKRSNPIALDYVSGGIPDFDMNLFIKYLKGYNCDSI